jgi:hypothetical protein
VRASLGTTVSVVTEPPNGPSEVQAGVAARAETVVASRGMSRRTAEMRRRETMMILLNRFP